MLRAHACILIATALVAPALHAQARQPQRVLVDEGHFNAFAQNVRHYRAFLRAVADDDFHVETTNQPFTPEQLGAINILVIAGAHGAPASAPIEARAASAFTADEVDAIEQWVAGGGSLLLVTDHDPTSPAAERLTDRLGILGSGTWIDDQRFRVPEQQAYPGWLLFSRESGLVGDHPITRGMQPGDRIERVISAGGEALVGPPGSTSLLTLSRTAYDVQPPRFPLVIGLAPGGGSQGIAFEFGKGRIVALADGALLTGVLDIEGYDNRTFAANIIRWLARRM